MLAAALALFLSGDVGVGQAQSVQALVGNLAHVEDTANINLSDDDAAQEFETGDNETGYTLSSIDLNLTAHSQLPMVKVFSGSATGTEVAALTAPSLESGRSNYTYTAPMGITLAKETSYWVVAEGVDSFWYRAQTTEDANPAAGWSIADNAQSRSADSTGSFASAGNPMAIRVNGTINPSPPLVSNSDAIAPPYVSVGNLNDRAQKFSTGANATGYTLSNITLGFFSITRGALPTVTLHSGSATGPNVANLTYPNAGFMVPSNSATALSFHPAGTLRLSRLTDYWVVIEEGVDELFIQVATSDDGNPDSAAGWSIEDGSGVRPATGTGSFSRSATPLAIRVNGTINPPPALVSNIGQALHDHASLGSASDLAQGFKVGSSAATLTGIDLNLRSQNNGTTPPR